VAVSTELFLHVEALEIAVRKAPNTARSATVPKDTSAAGLRPARTDGQIQPSLLMLSNGTASTQMTLDKAEQLLDAVHGCMGGQSG
jgi:hypothetical protein